MGGWGLGEWVSLTGGWAGACWGGVSGVGGPPLLAPGDVRGLWGGAHDLRDLGEREGPAAEEAELGVESNSSLFSRPSILSASMRTF